MFNEELEYKGINNAWKNPKATNKNPKATKIPKELLDLKEDKINFFMEYPSLQEALESDVVLGTFNADGKYTSLKKISENLLNKESIEKLKTLFQDKILFGEFYSTIYNNFINMLVDQSDSRKNMYEEYYKEVIDKNKSFGPNNEPEDIKQVADRSGDVAQRLQEIIDNENRIAAAADTQRKWFIGVGIVGGILGIAAIIRYILLKKIIENIQY